MRELAKGELAQVQNCLKIESVRERLHARSFMRGFMQVQPIYVMIMYYNESDYLMGDY